MNASSRKIAMVALVAMAACQGEVPGRNHVARKTSLVSPPPAPWEGVWQGPWGQVVLSRQGTDSLVGSGQGVFLRGVIRGRRVDALVQQGATTWSGYLYLPGRDTLVVGLKEPSRWRILSLVRGPSP